MEASIADQLSGSHTNAEQICKSGARISLDACLFPASTLEGTVVCKSKACRLFRKGWHWRCIDYSLCMACITP